MIGLSEFWQACCLMLACQSADGVTVCKIGALAFFSMPFQLDQGEFASEAAKVSSGAAMNGTSARHSESLADFHCRLMWTIV